MTPLLIYGANGYTGRLIAEEAVQARTQAGAGGAQPRRP